MQTLRKHLLFSLAITLVAFWSIGCGGSSSSSDDDVLAEMMAEQAADSNGQTTIDTSEGGVSRDGAVAVAANGSKMSVLAFGDSNVEGFGVSQPWPDKLELALGAPVYREGKFGMSSAEGLAQLPSKLDQLQPTHVCIMLGSVDTLQVLDPIFTLENLGQMVDICVARGLPVVIGTLLPAPGADAERNAVRLIVDDGIGQAGTRGAKVARISQTFGEGTTLLQEDGIHANDAGHAIIASLYLEQLR